MPVRPTIAVIIPAFGPTPHLRDVLNGVRAQSRAADAVYLSHSGSHDPTDWLACEYPEVTVLHSDERLFAGAARNRAARITEADILAFTDCDTRPDLRWLEHAESRLRGSTEIFVVGSVSVARGGGYWGMTTWLCEFSEQAPWRRSGEQRGGASCNMAVRKAHLSAVDFFPEDFRAGQDTMLFHRLRSSGRIQVFAPEMEVSHFNIPGFGHMARHLYNQGRHFAKVRTFETLPGHIAIRYWPLAPLLGVAKGGKIIGRMLGHINGLSKVIYLPGILLGVAIWNAGCTYAAVTRNFTGRY